MPLKLFGFIEVINHGEKNDKKTKENNANSYSYFNLLRSYAS